MASEVLSSIKNAFAAVEIDVDEDALTKRMLCCPHTVEPWLMVVLSQSITHVPLTNTVQL